MISQQHKIEQDTKIAERRVRVTELHLEGMSLRQIGTELDISHVQVKRDLDAVRAEWQSERIVNYDQMVCESDARIERVRQEAWAGWRRSQDDDTTKKTAKIQGGPQGDQQKAEMTVRGQAGNPAFLNTILKCEEDRRKLHGLDAPQRSEVTGAGGGPIQVEDLSDEQLVAILLAEKGDSIPGIDVEAICAPLADGVHHVHDAPVQGKLASSTSLEIPGSSSSG